MLKTYASRVAAGAAISAALTAGSLGLTATAASACTNPRCLSGSPPVAASAMECTDTGCHSGTKPAQAEGEVSTAASEVAPHAGISTSINCPPPNPSVTALTRGISDC